MATLVLTNPSITIGGTDVTALSNTVTLNFEIDSIEATAFGGQHIFVGGLQNNSADITLLQDYAATKTEVTVYPLVGTQTTVVIKPVNTTTSATNPTYTLSNTFLSAHTPVQGGVGELVTTSLTFTGGTLVKTTA